MGGCGKAGWGIDGGRVSCLERDTLTINHALYSWLDTAITLWTPESTGLGWNPISKFRGGEGASARNDQGLGFPPAL